MPRTSWKDLAGYEIRWPGQQDAEASSRQVDGLRLLANPLVRENETSAWLRDTLLQPLLSGRHRVKDAEKQVEDAV